MTLSSLSLVDATRKTAFSQMNLALPVVLICGDPATYLPDSNVNPIISGVGATNDADFGLVVPCALNSSQANFSFGFGGSGGLAITVPVGEFVIPIFLENGSQPTFKDGGTVCEFGLMSSGTGDIALGDSFLRSAYVVYDLTNKQIGLAQTVFNETLSDIVEIDSGIPYASATATAMATQTYTETVTKTETVQFANEPGSPTFTLFGLNATATSSTSASHATVSNQPNHSMTHSAKLGIGLGVPFGMIVISPQ